MKTFSVLFMLALYLLSGQALASSFFPAPLIKADWLAEHIDKVVILDTRKELESFNKEGHIENAVLVNVNTYRPERIISGKKITRMRPDSVNFQKFMREHGINNDSRVVITHRGKTPGHVAGAARLYWHFKYYGFEDVALLDGGNAAWVAALEDLTSEKTVVTQGAYSVGQEHSEIVATMQQVKDALDNDSVTLIDTRGLRYHIGIEKKDYVYAYGHIPGSRNLPYKFLHPTKGHAVYYSKQQLEEIILSLGINLDKELILYCNSAYECSSDWFVLVEILGKKDVRIYDGSLHQWTQYDDNPMTRKLTL